jgi:hypothetical protein
MKFTQKILLTITALGAAALTAFSQGIPPSGSYTANTLTLPVSTLAANVTTNFGSGWSSIGSYTNSSITFSNTTFVTNTTIGYYTNTLYADMSMQMQDELAIVISETAGIGTNVFTFGHGLDSTSVDTNATFSLTINQPAAGAGQASTNLPAFWNGGFGTVRLISIQWTAAAASWTNNYLKWATKRYVW